MAKIHLIGNAHLDPVWLWRWQEGFSEILATYRSALDMPTEGSVQFLDKNLVLAKRLFCCWF